MKTAAAFAKGLLELEGQLTPILASLVTIEEKNRQMLDHGSNKAAKEALDQCKQHINMIQDSSFENMYSSSSSSYSSRTFLSETNQNQNQNQGGRDEIGKEGGQKGGTEEEAEGEEFIEKFAKDCPDSIRRAIKAIGNPIKCLRRLHVLVGQLCAQLHSLVEQEAITVSETVDPETGEVMEIGVDPAETSYMENSHNLDTHARSNSADMGSKLYLGETFSLMLDRWEKLNKDFFDSKTGMYDLSKIPDVYDMIRYDILHNSHVPLKGVKELYDRVRALENAVVPQEYGKDKEQKSFVGSQVCGALLEKIKYDLIVSRSDTTYDMRFMLDHSHAQDLDINSLGRVVRTRLYVRASLC